MTKWIDLGSADDFPDGAQVCSIAEGRPIVAFRVQGEFHVIRNECPHAGLPLGDGDRRGHVITCPYHGYAYNIRNGRNIDWPEEEPPVQTFPVRVVDGRVQIEVECPVNDEHPKTGPAPDDDGDASCDPTPDHQDGDKPACPDGYPDEQNTPPQQPSTDKPRPKPQPTKQGE